MSLIIEVRTRDKSTVVLTMSREFPLFSSGTYYTQSNRDFIIGFLGCWLNTVRDDSIENNQTSFSSVKSMQKES